jgi:hypothetical protein
MLSKVEKPARVKNGRRDAKFACAVYHAPRRREKQLAFNRGVKIVGSVGKNRTSAVVRPTAASEPWRTVQAASSRWRNYLAALRLMGGLDRGRRGVCDK